MCLQCASLPGIQSGFGAAKHYGASQQPTNQIDQLYASLLVYLMKTISSQRFQFHYYSSFICRKDNMICFQILNID
jgi:hypothetical protein